MFDLNRSRSLASSPRAGRFDAWSETRSASKQTLALLMRLLWAAALLPLPCGTQAAAILTLYSFTGTNDGAFPAAGLLQGSDGYLYGTTYRGGTGIIPRFPAPPGIGTVFKISTSGTFTSLCSFGPTNGAFPAAELVQGSDGYLYGTTTSSGQYPGRSHGTVFRISTSGALTSLYSFTGGSDGANPNAGLVQGSDGDFYGTTLNSVFQISTNGALTTLFCSLVYPGPHFNGLVQGSDGRFYGTTEWNQGNGTVFRISTNGEQTILHSFTGGNDGANPIAGLAQGSDGYFYGTTGGLTNNPGTVFKIDTNGVLATFYAFGSITNASGVALDGAGPNGLVQGRDGNLYGTTYLGGTSNNGTVFRISTNGTLTTLYSFTGGDDGASPTAALLQGSDGDFYGTTYYGGTNGAGTVFRLTLMPPPQLTIIPSGPYVVLTWPTTYGGFDYSGFTLQSTTNPFSSAAWTTNPPGPVVIGGQSVVVNTISGIQRFYRLIQ